jgi:streptomycin 6-kinase
MVATAERLFGELLSSSGPPVLLHGDLHQENILRAERDPWLAIDPKGLAGEPAYEVGALLRNPGDRVRRADSPSRMMARRIAILAEALGIDAQRIVAWCYAQVVLSVWWGYEDHQEYFPEWLYYAELVEPLL